MSIVSRLLSQVRERLAPRGAVIRLGILAVAVFVLLDMSWVVLSPLFANLKAMGFHDWDSVATYRELTPLSLKRYHEMPWWHPYLCGGFPGWAYSEGGTNVVSPYLPAYLLLPLTLALRVEVVGSALTSFLGTYLLGSRFTKSIALRTLLAVVYTLNGRWALQTSAGHAWHLQYAWAPLALFFFDRSFERGKMRDAVLAGAILALMLYMGAIYPLPHGALLLCAYGLGMAIATRRVRPLLALTVAGLCAIGFSAPKLLPAVDLMRRFPRTVDSTEAVGLEQTVQMLVNPDQSFHRGVVPVPAWGWHEWGIYVGWPFVLAMAVALLFARGRRENVLKVVGLLFWVLGCGAFHPNAPWTLLHKVPVFASHHVPSRFMYTGVLILGLAFIAFAGRGIDRILAKFPIVDLALLVPVYFVAMDIAAVSRKATEISFVLEMPPTTWHEPFRQVTRGPYNYSPPDAWAGPTYLMTTSNEGFVGCNSVPDNAEPKGAIAYDNERYRGEAYIDGESGEARIVSWTPNTAEVEFTNASPGAVVVYNMNYDPSWRADGRPALDHRHAVAARVDTRSGRVKFRYFPRTMVPALLLFAFTVLAAFYAPRLLAKRRAASPTT